MRGRGVESQNSRLKAPHTALGTWPSGPLPFRLAPAQRLRLRGEGEPQNLPCRSGMHVSQNREQQTGQKLTSHLQGTLNNYSVSRCGVATLCQLAESSKIQCDSGESSPGPHFPEGHRGRGRQRERESGGRGEEERVQVERQRDKERGRVRR